MNYFNYFTEIEEHFQRRRGVQIMVSPVDWALMESWKEAGIPLEAVRAGIDKSFEKFATGRRRDISRLRSLVYCAPAVLDAAETMKEAAVGAQTAGAAAAKSSASTEFAPERVVVFLRDLAAQVRDASVPAAMSGVRDEICLELDRLSSGAQLADLENLERVLSVLDSKLLAGLEQHTPTEKMVQLHADLDRELAGYRRKLRAEQLALIERQFLHKRLLELYKLPRLSLFYLK